MLRDDIIIRAAIVAHSKRRTRFTPRAPPLVWNQTRSVDTVRCALDRPLCYFMTPQIFQGDFQENTQMLLVQERAIAVDLEFT